MATNINEIPSILKKDFPFIGIFNKWANEKLMQNQADKNFLKNTLESFINIKINNILTKYNEIRVGRNYLEDKLSEYMNSNIKQLDHARILNIIKEDNKNNHIRYIYLTMAFLERMDNIITHYSKQNIDNALSKNFKDIIKDTVNLLSGFFENNNQNKILDFIQPFTDFYGDKSLRIKVIIICNTKNTNISYRNHNIVPRLYTTNNYTKSLYSFDTNGSFNYNEVQIDLHNAEHNKFYPYHISIGGQYLILLVNRNINSFQKFFF